MKLTKKVTFLMLLSCFFTLLSSVFQTFNIHLSAQVLNGAEQGSLELVFRALIINAAAYLLYFPLCALAHVMRIAFLTNGTTDLRDKIMKNILARPLQLFRKHDDAYYLNLLGADMDLYRSNWLFNIPLIISGVGNVLFATFMLYRVHPWICVIGVLLSFIPLLTSNLFTKKTQACRQKVSQTAQEYSNVLKEDIEGCETIRMARGISPALKRFHIFGYKKDKAQRNSSVINYFSVLALWASAGVSNIICLGVGGYLAVQGLISISMLYAALNYVTILSNEFSNLMEYVIDFRASKPLVEKLKSETEVPCPADGGLVPAADRALVYEAVTFGFGDRKLYEDLSCSFAPGGCYAILGESGSGKSTLTKLLLKYYDDYEGTITLAGQDIRTLSEDEIYRVVGLVNQSPFLFNASLYDNITMFTNDPPKESDEYQKLLADLNLTALAQRVGDTPLGDFGDNISGGERQRINIARTLRSHPSILIFDEPTTGLDPENVALIDQFIFNRTDTTRIVITHNWKDDYLSRFDSVLRIGEKAPAEKEADSAALKNYCKYDKCDGRAL